MKLSKQSNNAPSTAPLQSLAQGSMFWRPEHIEQSAWLDHLPWIFWLMEAVHPQRCVTLGARRGSPHLALCQGVSRLGLDSECLLVAEDSDTAAEIHAQADRRYGALAGRLNVSPLRSVKKLDVGGIDILALDLAPDDEDMEDVLERWLSQVSDRGVVLIPGINRREPGCVAHEHFAALQVIYRSITFHQGDGLGVLMVGERPPELLETLISRWNSPTAARTVREVFARLGRACVDQALADAQTARLHSVKERLETVEQERLERVALLAQLQTQLKERDDYLGGLEADKLHLAEENADTQRKIQALQAELAQVRVELSDKDSAYQEVEQRRNVLETTVAERNSLIAEKDANIQTRFHELATMTDIAKGADRQKEVFKHEAELYKEKLDTERLEYKALLEARDKSLKELEADKLHLAEENADTQRTIQTLQAELAQLRAELSEKDAASQEAEQQRRVLETKVGDCNSLIAEKEANIQTRFRELATMTNIAEEADQQKDYFKQRAETYNQRNEEKKAELKQFRKAFGVVQQQLNARSEEVTTLKAGMEKLERELEKRDRSLADRFDELGSLTAALEEKERELVNLRGDGASQSSAKSAGLLSAKPHGLGIKSSNRKDQERKRRKQQEALAELEASEWFDSQWYLQQYPDIASDSRYSATPALHYLKFGGFEGRDPSPHFDSAGYLEAYPDVALTEINPLLHFIRDGINEGRSPRP